MLGWLVTAAWGAPAQVPDWFGAYPYREDLHWEQTSNVLLGAAFALPLVPVATDSPRDYALGAAEGFGSVAAALALGEVGKLASQRPRPYYQAGQCAPVGDRYACDLYGDTRDKSRGSVFASFPSGHTATVSASAFGWATARAVGAPDQPWLATAASYAGATGLTALTGFARVQAGKHHPSDVLVGGLLGATTGVVVPLVLHPLLAR